jgi:uncharacterized protein YjbI with pentapeptide repeats
MAAKGSGTKGSVAKGKGRVAPLLGDALLPENFAEQTETGSVWDASVSGAVLPALVSARGQATRIGVCTWTGVTLSDWRAQRLCLEDVRVDASDLANMDLTGGRLDRVEIRSTRLTGTLWVETQMKSVLFEECKMDLVQMRMAKLEHCVFERCNLTQADFYGADLTGTIFRRCDLSGVDLGQAKLAGADVRDCRLDGMRGTPASMDGLTISPDQAALLITLFGVKVVW